MYRYCSDCDNLNTKDSKGDGVYKCKKYKQYAYNTQKHVTCLKKIMEEVEEKKKGYMIL